MSNAFVVLVLGALLGAAALLWLAYGYTPKAAEGPPSRFLQTRSSRFFDAAGFRVHSVEAGAGPPLVLVHGGGLWLYSFRHELDALARHFRVIAVDMPGHGYTTRSVPGARYDFATTDAVLRGLLADRGLEAASLLGHSWGGGWALHFAQTHPERVRRLVLVGSSGLPHAERLEWELLKLPLVGEIIVKLMRRKDVRWSLEAAFAAPGQVTSEMVDETFVPLSRPESRLAQIRYSRNLDWRVTEAGMAALRSPTLVVWGQADAYGSLEQGRALANAIEGARFEVIADAGHNVHEEKPESFRDLVLDFLSPERVDSGR